jgi:precorrin-2 methylase
MSVKQENRYKKLVYSASQEANDRRREIEAAYMDRKARPPVIPVKPNATRQQVRSWMRKNVADYDDMTKLAEGANAALDLPTDALDDETHWIWDEAYLTFEWADK